MLALYIIAGILALVLVVASVPVDVSFDVHTHGAGPSRLRVRWLFNLVGRTLLPRKARPSGAKRKARKPRKRKAPRRGWESLRLLLPALRARGLVAEAARLVRRTVGSFRVRYLEARLRIGLGDPADTGLLYAVIWPLFLPGARSGRLHLDIVPVFEAPIFEADVSGSVRFYPSHLALNAFRFVLSSAGLRLIKTVVVQWWRRRK